MTSIFKSSVPAVRLILLANVLLVTFATALGTVQWSLAAVALVVGLYAVGNCLGSIVTFHRYLSHKSFEFRWKWLERVFITIGALTATGSPLGWVLIHVEHHKHSDDEHDPHTPLNGLWRTITFDYPYERNQWAIRRLVRDPFHLRLHNYYLLVLASFVAVLYAGFGLPGVVFGFSAPSVLVMAAQGFTNYVNHLENVGYRNYDAGDHSRNVWWMALVNFGEGFHNNHHHDPIRYTTRHKAGEFDPAGAVIRLVGRNLREGKIAA